MIVRRLCAVFATLLLMFFMGCYSRNATRRISVAEIPDKIYEIYVYSLTPDMYAVLLDIPDDGKRVFMRHTDRTERMGLGRPGPYVAQFQKRIRGFRSAIRIIDEEGIERGYLMVSVTLSYMLRPYGNEIMVYIWDPFSDEELGPRLHPGILRENPIKNVR